MRINKMKTAFITGITGQDGGYLAEFLLAKGYAVHGLVRWDAVDGTGRLQELGIASRVMLHYGDLCDAASLISLIKNIQPDEIYNLAALSHVKVSFETPASTLDINARGTLNVLDAVRILGLDKARIYQASSSEMFGKSPPPQNELTPFAPCSPYGAAKLAAYWMARTYREAYGVHVCNGILFNHESPLRGEDFVTQKIAKAVAAIEAGQQDRLVLGNIDSVRDWGHARDYTQGMWLMMQQDKADDFVLATGAAHTVREFAQRCFAQVGIDLEWRGKGLEEIGVDSKTGKILVSIDGSLFRPLEVDYLLGDAAKARRILGWEPRIFFDELAAEMVNAERKKLWKGDLCRKAG